MEVKRLSPKVEQLLKRWQDASTVLKIELSSKYISVFGEGIVGAVKTDQVLLDSKGFGFRILLADATFDPPITADSLPEPPRLSEKEPVANQLQLSVPGGQRVILTELARGK